ncbi:MAG: hypothetical protein AAFP19_07100 [Bacteroidota bacterium]
MLRHLKLLCLLVFLLGCGTPSNQADQIASFPKSISEDTLALKEKGAAIPLSEQHYYTTDCDTFLLDETIELVQGRQRFRTFEAQNLIYCSPKENAEVLDSLPFNTKLTAYESIRFNSSSERWLKISHKNSVAYIKATVAWDNIWESGNALIVTTEDGQISLRTYPKDQPHVLRQTYAFPFMALERKVDVLIYNGLEATGQVIRYHGFSQYQGINQVINVSPEGEIAEIISAQFENDWEYSHQEVFYYPMTFGNGTTLLVHQADYENIFDTHTASLRTFPYPADIGIPINQLIIKEVADSAAQVDEQGNTITDDGTADGMPIQETTKSIRTYYRWNGKKCIKIK